MSIFAAPPHISDFDPPVVTARDPVGSRENNVEHKSVDYIRSDFQKLVESENLAALQLRYEAEIKALHTTTFELEVPEPRNE